jgi:DNA-binding beta-propeller fold protein YncE
MGATVNILSLITKSSNYFKRGGLKRKFLVLISVLRQFVRRSIGFPEFGRCHVRLAAAMALAVTGASVANAQVFLGAWGTFGSGDGQFNIPNGLDIEGDEVYVSDIGNNRVQVFDRSGTFLRMWGTFGTGDGQFNSPGGVHVEGHEVYVTDLANNRVQVFDSSGTFLRKWGTFGTGDGSLILRAVLPCRVTRCT